MTLYRYRCAAGHGVVYVVPPAELTCSEVVGGDFCGRPLWCVAREPALKRTRP